MMKFLAIFLLIGVACANPTLRFGFELLPSLPYHISIESKESGPNICSGAIISEYWAVTAARCMHPNSTTSQIRAGSKFVGEGGSIHNISRVIKHENFTHGGFQTTSTNDIALIEVATPFVMDSRRQPIELITSLNQSSAGSLAIRSSYITHSELLIQDVLLVTRDICRNTWGELAPNDPSQLCSYGIYINTEKWIVEGNIEGSLVAVDGRLSGIAVQWVVDSDVRDRYSCAIYTDISYFRDWIKKHSNV